MAGNRLNAIRKILCHYLSSNRFLAGTANSLSVGLDAEFVEVRLQISQHVVQLVGWFCRSTG